VKTYRACWLLTALSFGVVGFGAALVLRQAALLVLLPLFAVLGLVAALLWGANPAGTGPWNRARHTGLVACLSGATAGALAGFSALMGPAACLVALLLVATAPRTLSACRRRLSSMPHPTTAQLDALARSLACASPTYSAFDPALDLRLLTDEQLCTAWHDSQRVVSSPCSRRSLARVVAERGRYLDEFERRQPSLLRAWLASEIGATDSLLPHAIGTRQDVSPIDWDELTGGQGPDR
jgi:hypothetical protein